MIKKLYPNGKEKAFNLTYDDGIYDDYKFVELLNKYNLKGTFNLNSKLMKENYDNAIKTTLLMRNDLPFSKRTLYEDITALSYKGDMRMLLHFENPDKIKNKVNKN